LEFDFADERKPERSADGLVRIASWVGNLFAHPERSIDDYDDIWVAEIGLQYGVDQPPLEEVDARRLRKMIYDIARQHLPSASRLAVRGAGPCTLKLGVHLASLDLHWNAAGARGLGGAIVVFEFRDSQSNVPIVRYGERRTLDFGAQRASNEVDFDRLETSLRTAIDDVSLNLRDELPVNPTDARKGLGCQGTVGNARAHVISLAR
jgi:hypothetical protein